MHPLTQVDVNWTIDPHLTVLSHFSYQVTQLAQRLGENNGNSLLLLLKNFGILHNNYVICQTECSLTWSN